MRTARTPSKSRAAEEGSVSILDRGAALASRLKAITGDETITVLSQDRNTKVENYISTQSAVLDAAIGRPGCPCGRIVGVFGDPSVGKTTLSYHLMAEVQRLGGFSIYVDLEAAALDEDRARLLGVDPDKVIYSMPHSLDAAANQIEKMVDMIAEEMPDQLGVIILDSVAGGATEEELSAEAGKRTIGSHARLMSQVLRRLPPKVAKTKVLLVIINQYKVNVGAAFGPQKTMVAERACRFACSLVIELTDAGKLSVGEGADKEDVAQKTRFKIGKSKVARPFRKGLLEVGFTDENAGFDVMGDLFEVGVRGGVIEKHNGGWYSFAGQEKKFRDSKFESALLDYPEAFPALINAIGVEPAYPPEAKIVNLLDELRARHGKDKSEDAA